MLELIKTALHLTVDDYDTELQMHINSCLSQLALIGINPSRLSMEDENVVRTVYAYCRSHFKSTPDASAWLDIYDMNVKTLQMSSGYGLEGDCCD